jgi:hypothetical protein
MRYDDQGFARPEERPAPPRARLGMVIFLSMLVSVLASVLVTIGLNMLLVPGGVGWRKLQHEGTVTVHGVNNPLKVHYPSPFSKPPSLHIEPTQQGEWFYQINEQTESYFVIVNTTVDANTGGARHLSIKWTATGGKP